jgi:hypothetical protein
LCNLNYHNSTAYYSMSLLTSESFASRAEDDAQQRDDEDEDNLSITSTNPEDGDTEKEWFVDDVLAERPHPDDPTAAQYLIKWEGFELQDCTWEPVENLGDGLLSQWEENKKEVDAGTRQPFDLGAYDAALAARMSRHVRRNAKRQRLGLSLTPPFPPEYTDGALVASPANYESSESDDEAQEVNEVDPAIPPSATKSKATTTSKILIPAEATAQPTVQSVVKQRTFAGIPSQAPPKAPSISKISEKGRGQHPSSSVVNPSSKTPTTGSSASTITGSIRNTSVGSTTGYQGTARRSSIFRPTTTKTSTPSTSHSNNRPLATTIGSSAPSSASTNPSTGKRLTATRTRQLPVSSAPNVFAGGKQRKKRANLGDVMSDPTKAPKAFSNMRILNIAKKRGIEKGDAVGALSSIPSKFILGNDQTNTESKRPSLISPAITGSSHINQEASVASSVPVTAVHRPQTTNEFAEKEFTEEVPTLRRKKSVRFTVEEGNGAIDDLFDEPLDTNPSLEGPDAMNGVLAPSRTVPLAAYHERGQTQTIQKLAKFGHAEAININFSGIIRNAAPWLTAFKARRVLDLTCTCSSFHFQSQKNQLVLERVSAGVIEPVSEEHTVALTNIATSLQRVSIGLHLVERDFAILIYPGNCSDWEWIDSDVKELKPEALLRHVIYRSAITPRAYPSEFYKDPNAFSSLVARNGSNDPEEIGKLTKLDFNKLGPQDVTLKDKQVYMLLIPLKAQQLLRAVMVWLRE